MNQLHWAVQDGAQGTRLVTANVGDARILLIKSPGQEPVQLTVDHVPDSEVERQRIERFNPNPKMPLVRYVGGTWRVGGLLALSRAFGDAYLKGSLQFEGIVEGSDGYGSGFGVIAEPYIRVLDVSGGYSKAPIRFPACAFWSPFYTRINSVCVFLDFGGSVFH
jgi:protein phosphatase 1K